MILGKRCGIYWGLLDAEWSVEVFRKILGVSMVGFGVVSGSGVSGGIPKNGMNCKM